MESRSLKRRRFDGKNRVRVGSQQWAALAPVLAKAVASLRALTTPGCFLCVIEDWIV